MIESDTHCENCGVVIVRETPNGNSIQQKLCPQCRLSARTPSPEVHPTIHLTGSAKLTFATYPQTLLATCESLINDGHYGISVVVAQVACEVSVERALSAAFKSKKLQYLEEPMLGFLNGYNLGNDRIRKLYTALTSDNIEHQSFWSAFKKSVVLRNKIAHNGKIASEQEARDSYKAASAFITHLNQ